MNETSIRDLAGRAAALEDRTGDRVSEIHDRIDAARRHRRTVAVGSVAAVLLVAAVSFAVVTSTRDDNTPQPAPPPDTPNAGSSAGPARGTCWDMPGKDMFNQDHWYDDSPQVPCDQPHTAETVLFYELDEPTIEEGEKYLERCRSAAGAYAGVDFASWIPWGFVLVGPSEQQVDDGASWARCDVVFTTTWDFTTIRTTTGSAVGIADKSPDDLWACLNKPPRVYDQPLVPCDQPHGYEATGTLAYVGGSQTFPTQAQLDDAVRTHCERAVPAELPGVSVVVAWPTPAEAQFEPYDDIASPCFIYDPSGRPLPPR
jgi:hypothetical protein